MTGRWPYPGDTDLVVARKVAVAYRTHFRASNPQSCARVDDAMRGFGQLWVVSSVVTTEADEMVTTAEAAQLAGVGVEAIRKWRNRGYVDRDGVRRHLEVRGLNEQGWPMFVAGEVLGIVAAIRSRNAGA